MILAHFHLFWQCYLLVEHLGCFVVASFLACTFQDKTCPSWLECYSSSDLSSCYMIDCFVSVCSNLNSLASFFQLLRIVDHYQCSGVAEVVCKVWALFELVFHYVNPHFDFCCKSLLFLLLQASPLTYHLAHCVLLSIFMFSVQLSRIYHDLFQLPVWG